jgi:hypothetical protein
LKGAHVKLSEDGMCFLTIYQFSQQSLYLLIKDEFLFMPVLAWQQAGL